MPIRFRVYSGDWVELRKMNPREVDLHFGKLAPDRPYWEAMADVFALVWWELQRAHKDAIPYVLFLHGASTSLGWQKTTARSTVRGIMRSPASTPYIIRADCIQHETAFLARIRGAELSHQNMDDTFTDAAGETLAQLRTLKRLALSAGNRTEGIAARKALEEGRRNFMLHRHRLQTIRPSSEAEAERIKRTIAYLLMLEHESSADGGGEPN